MDNIKYNNCSKGGKKTKKKLIINLEKKQNIKKKLGEKKKHDIIK